MIHWFDTWSCCLLGRVDNVLCVCQRRWVVRARDRASGRSSTHAGWKTDSSTRRQTSQSNRNVRLSNRRGIQRAFSSLVWWELVVMCLTWWDNATNTVEPAAQTAHSYYYKLLLLLFLYPRVYSSQGLKAKKKLKSKLEWLLFRSVVDHKGVVL